MTGASEIEALAYAIERADDADIRETLESMLKQRVAALWDTPNKPPGVEEALRTAVRMFAHPPPGFPLTRRSQTAVVASAAAFAKVSKDTAARHASRLCDRDSEFRAAWQSLQGQPGRPRRSEKTGAK